MSIVRTPLVELTGAARVYRGAEPVHALRDVDLELCAGDYVSVTGASGSGKSTLLNVLGLLDGLDEGHYRFEGVDVAGLAERARSELRAGQIGFIFQDSYMIAHLTVRENVALPLKYSATGLEASAARRRTIVDQALEEVGLAARAEASPTTLSGGERQRAAVARALVNRPRLLLCDEPTGSLDSDNGRRVLGLLESLLDSTVALVVVTHDESVARRAHRTLRMSDGVLDEPSTPGGRSR